jgi:hypothetical protein
MQFVLVHMLGEQPRLQFINDAWFSAFSITGGIRPPIANSPFNIWVWELPQFNSIYELPAFAVCELVEAMNWANEHGTRVPAPPPDGQPPPTN